ncbi:twin-arginine translocase subunit TatC [Microbacterium rhizosphaerae]|uniref:Sec-independent protein translocase protein TatC n=1 Tax=Microbacterium rhizosphaerae TaxID=1678237 RepID=A0ABZ0SQ01_9MICO|nr:twin-arginine translocase subunit TatC [Microbacterium rhizosphaerae]WPR91452.1 twin-arginine translocase subunit TatC [Microbacterium rhizosphaerae]
MPLIKHLLELRRRLFIAAAALIVGMVIAFIISGPVIDLLAQPIKQIAVEQGRLYTALNFNTVSSGFDLHMRIAFSIGLLLSAPIWLWQIWAFIMPGLTRKEIRYTIGFLGAAVPLFAAGLYVGWLIMPHMVLLMANFVPEGKGISQFYDYSTYYDFVFKLLLVIGVSFVTPVFLVALNLAGVVSGRGILKAWRIAIVVIAVFAAAATPAADVTSMLLLGGILAVLYFAAVGISMLFDRRKRKREKLILPPDPVE